MDVERAIEDALLAAPPHITELYVGFSGGLDSTVLLYALHRAWSSTQRAIHPVHIHHGLSSQADQWGQHCAEFASALGLSLQLIHVTAQPIKKESPEATARRARYDAFRNLISANSLLILGHHANDQAETVLLQLFRGAGIKGLAAMPVLTTFSEGYLARPFLSLSREQLEAYAQQHHLTWVEDESNACVDFDRNYLRHHILPLVTTRWLGALHCLSRSAHHCGEAQELLDELAEQDIAQASSESNAALNVLALKSLSPIRLNNALRYWFHKQGLPLPSTAKLQTLIQTVLCSRYDSSPRVTWPGAEVRRFRHELYAMRPLTPHDPSWQYLWDLKEDLILPSDLGVLRVNDYEALAQGESLTIAFRQGGELIQLPGRKGHHCLKKLMQEWHIPPWLRNRIPLIFRAEKLISIRGYA
ncbi:MAG: tRNA lysidine(34) synthetase TilS [Gammaproteobacteria bacterium]|nr:tRNA lysidine(34) synthetase TilS [Gammaproteobacteria bacterium]